MCHTAVSISLFSHFCPERRMNIAVRRIFLRSCFILSPLWGKFADATEPLENMASAVIETASRGEGNPKLPGKATFAITLGRHTTFCRTNLT